MASDGEAIPTKIWLICYGVKITPLYGSGRRLQSPVRAYSSVLTRERHSRPGRIKCRLNRYGLTADYRSGPKKQSGIPDRLHIFSSRTRHGHSKLFLVGII